MNLDRFNVRNDLYRVTEKRKKRCCVEKTDYVLFLKPTRDWRLSAASGARALLLVLER
jgi:hypothetical protein